MRFHNRTGSLRITSTGVNTLINIENLRRTLNTKIIGNPHKEIYYQVASTNDIAIEYGKSEEVKEGRLVIADHQTAGRGRYGRTWYATPGKCILASVTFSHRLKRDQLHLPNLIGALSIAQGIYNHTGLTARIKYPNDVRIEQKKVAGVLTDIEYDQHHVPFFVLGFGVNVNITEDEFPKDLREIATSLQIAASQHNEKDLCRITLLNAILSYLEEYYLHLKTGKIDIINNHVKSWAEKL